MVQEHDNGLTVDELALKVGERSVLCQSLESGHQRVALLAALSLTNAVRVAIIVVPVHRTAARRGAEAGAPSGTAERQALTPMHET